MIEKDITKDLLRVLVYSTRKEMGKEAALAASEYINNLLNIKREISIVFASAPSQNEFIASLIKCNIEWSRINAFHMDEYVGLERDAPQTFGNFLKINLFDKVSFKSVNYMNDEHDNLEERCERYSELLKSRPIDIIFMGIGENGHIAFNDPHVAFFNDSESIKIVELDDICRLQQVNDGCFLKLEDVPTHAITLTIPTLMSAERIFCIVPASSKANAVRETVMGEIDEKCPASVLRRHKNATLYCDKESAKYIL